ncbi:MAG: hypothetical protein V2J55_19500 [Candidatus Competibacteraceae bacterium]|jgi:hypothetical protein|nr:hypothetical protein [Candidatus Competibacteraceae bacterium]
MPPIGSKPSIHISHSTTRQEINEFLSKVDDDHQLRAKRVWVTGNNGKKHQVYKLYAKKSSKTGGNSNSIWESNRTRPDKFLDGRKAVNIMLQRLGHRADLFSENNKVINGLQLKAKLDNDKLIVDKHTTLNDLKQIGARIGNDKEVHGKLNEDGTITLFGAAKSNKMNTKRKRELQTAAGAALNVMENTAKKQHLDAYGVMDKMIDSYFYNSQKSTRTQRAYDDPNRPLTGKQFSRRIDSSQNAGLEHLVKKEAQTLTPHLNHIATKMFDRDDLDETLKPGQGGSVNDPLRQDNKDKTKTLNNIRKIQHGQMNQVTTKDMFDSFSHVAKNSPVVPLNKLAPLANSNHVAGAVGLYSGNNTFGKQPIKTPPDRNAAMQLRDEINNTLTPQERAQLKARVELMSKMADVYSQHQPNLPGLGNNNKAKHTKSMAVNYSTWVGHPTLDVNAAIGGNARTSGIKARDLMTALVLHKDIIFPPPNQQAVDDHSEFENDSSISSDAENSDVDDFALENHANKLGAWQQLLGQLGHQINTSKLDNGLEDLTQGLNTVMKDLQTVMNQGGDDASPQPYNSLNKSITALEENLATVTPQKGVANLQKELVALRETLGLG